MVWEHQGQLTSPSQGQQRVPLQPWGLLQRALRVSRWQVRHPWEPPQGLEPQLLPFSSPSWEIWVPWPSCP